jgi:hypothetical protein
MLSNYFKDFEKKIIKKGQKSTKPEKDTTSGKKSISQKSPASQIDMHKIQEQLGRIIPKKLKIDAVRPISASGFSPEGADLIIYTDYCEDLLGLFNGSIPQELVYGTVSITQKLDKKGLSEVLNRVAGVKKINFFASNDESTQQTIPAFIIAAESSIPLAELKNDMINHYMSNNIDFSHEVDVLMVINKGLVIKNWREKRSFIGLDTGKDSMMWFYVLINEYLEIEKSITLDMRKYIKNETIYPEY